MGELEDQAGQLFETFIQASTCKGTLQAFNILCRQLDLDPSDYSAFYRNLKRAVTSWKATPLWNKLDKRASHKEYKKGTACPDTRCLIIGGGPCGLRTAIELALLGAKVVLIEKRDSFSRNNVLHLWPYTIHDLKELGAKKFYGKFCAGAIDHISIRQLQLMLMKIALIVGVEIHVKVEFVKLLEPPEDKGTDGPGWRAKVLPADHSLNDYEFDVIVGADGRRNTLDGFRRKEFRGKLAIAITANFVNRHTTAEAKVEEISGVAFIFNQKFFLDLKDDTGIDLENIVYYKDDTHYFVMTAKKQSLLDKGVIIRDHIETEKLLGSDNVNQDALLSYAREAADFGTDYQLPSLDYAINHQGKPDVAMFDFTSMYASENAALIREKAGHELLVALVGDSLLEPFWPMGTGCARGFLAAFDTAWMVRSWAQGKAPLEILSERESLYRLLPQTTPENISKNIEQYTIDPASRYPNLNSSCVRQHQVKHLYICGEQNSALLERGTTVRRSVKRRESDIRPSRLLTWCQRQTEGYRGVQVTDLSSSWRSGLALCALIHNFHPELIDFDSLNEENVEGNNQLGFDVAARELGIQPVTTGKEMASQPQPDKLMMVLYLSKFYEKFLGAENDAQQRKKRLQKDEKVEEQRAKRRREESAVHEAPSAESSVRSMQDLRARFENASSEVPSRLVYTPVYLPTPQPSPASNPSPPIFRSLSTPAPSCYSPIRTPSPPSPPPPPSSSIHHPMTSSSSSSSSSNSVHISSALSCLPLVPAVPEPSKQCNGAALSCELSQIHLSENDDIDSPTLSSHTQRTVGKVSSVIGAKAETLAHLYETDHRPKAAPAAPHSPGSTRREIPLTVGGSDVCHSCHKRVYVMERVCMEGYFFHRECFKCDECLCTLRQGGNAFNSGQGRFLCKLHYSQFLSNARNRGRTAESHPVSTLDGRAIGVGTPGTATGCSQQHRASEGQSYGAPRGRLNPSIVAPRGRLDPNIVAERPEETQVEPASALGNPGSSSDARPQTAESHSVPSSDSGSTSCSSSLSEEGKGQRSTSKGANKNHYWRRKIRATLPLILVKTFARGRATDNKQDGSTEDGESDFEEIHEHDHKEASSSSPSETPAGSQPQPAAEKKCPVAQPEVPTLTITTDDSQGLPERPDPHLTSSIPVSIATSSTTATATSSSTTSSTASSLASSSQLQPASQESHNDGHKKKEVELEQQQHQVSSNATNSPKKKLVLSTTEREKLLDWDVEPSEGSDPSLPPAGIRNGSCGPPALPADGKPPASGSLPQSAPPAPAAAVMATKRTPDAQAQNGPPPQSAFQIWASSLKRSLAGASSNRDTTSTSTTTTNVVRRGKVAPSRARPLSEGSFNIGSIFGNQNQQASSGGGQENLVTSSTTNTTTNSSSGLENGHAGQRRPDGGGGGGGELTELLQQVALSTSSKPTTKDDMAFLPRRKVNFFSSLRVKSQAEVERGRGGGADQNIWNILSKFRNKASTQTPVEEEEEDERASSSDDREDLPSDYHGDPRRKENVSERRRRRQERIVQQQAKREQLKRLHRAQTIQRQLEEVEETQRALEEKGVTLEKVLRGETDNKDMEDDPELLQTWFKLVLEKNKLQRYESELMIFAQELELEDTQSQLQQDLRHKMSIDDSMKTSADLSEEQRMLVEIMQVVEKRDQLVSLLEEQRLKERAEDQDLESMLLSKRYQLHWT
ncbi:F-actin-monooxygenase mical2b isoform X2 [Engraulis encrasicolus]|uniref:F-actin-monooxygenase mical2b isoform X2 n=1 Tax=Engraulis encrasicolus TaxID=184585 RepID=UPI002FD1507F